MERNGWFVLVGPYDTDKAANEVYEAIDTDADKALLDRRTLNTKTVRFSRSPDMTEVLEHLKAYSDKTELTLTVPGPLRVVFSPGSSMTYINDGDGKHVAWMDATCDADMTGGWVIGGFDSPEIVDGPFDVCDIQP